MELKEIQQLIKFVSTSGVDEVAIEQKDFKISIKKSSKVETITVTAAPSQIQAAVPASAAPVAATPASAIPASAPQEKVSENTVTIKSPMIGTFYRSPSPDKPAFVNVGDTVKKGQTCCIVEAMKLFNEIESEFNGTIVKVLVDDATPVEYDQPLFVVELK
jgi:acetyl-CoA carboxylase biotin carboxyl carrier protein